MSYQRPQVQHLAGAVNWHQKTKYYRESDCGRFRVSASPTPPFKFTAWRKKSTAERVTDDVAWVQIGQRCDSFELAELLCAQDALDDTTSPQKRLTL